MLLIVYMVSSSIRKFFFMLLACVYISLLLFFSPGFIFYLLLAVTLLSLAVKHTDYKDKRFILYIMLLALALKSLSIICLQYYCASKNILDIYGDAANNFQLAYYLKYFFWGDFARLKILKEQSGLYNVHGLTFFDALYFASFGDNEVISLKNINGLFVVFSGWLIYDLTKKIYSVTAGRIAISVYLFWPTMFVWSVTNLKESHVISSVIMMFWCFNALFQEAGLRSKLFIFILTILSAGYAISLRPQTLMPVFFLTVTFMFAYLSFSYCTNSKRNLSIVIFIFILLGIIIVFKESGYLLQIIKNYFLKMMEFHKGYLSSGGWNFNLIGNATEYLTVSFFIKYLCKAWYHVLFEPLPWHMFSISMLISYPMMMVWYCILLLSAVGVIHLIRLRSINKILALLIFIMLYLTCIGMSIANIGTLVRFRDLAMPFIVIFASCGVIRLLSGCCFCKKIDL